MILFENVIGVSGVETLSLLRLLVKKVCGQLLCVSLKSSARYRVIEVPHMLWGCGLGSSIHGSLWTGGLAENKIVRRIP